MEYKSPKEVKMKLIKLQHEITIQDINKQYNLPNQKIERLLINTSHKLTGILKLKRNLK